MKIKVKQLDFNTVANIPKPDHKDPVKPMWIFRFLMKALGASDLKATHFRNDFVGIDGFPDEPCLVLMNHSSFIDLEIASNIMYPKPFAIVCTSDGFVGKEWLMRNLGCIPTNKFITDVGLMSDIRHALTKNRTSVLLYPEASYSFDGRATPLPRRFGAFLKRLGVPVIMITTYGAFLRDPLYNMLRKRKVNVRSTTELLFSKERLKELTVEDIDNILDGVFSFDHFRWQQQNGIVIDEAFRADGLERILYKCPRCGSEGFMEGKGTVIRCTRCGAEDELDETGKLVERSPGTVPEAMDSGMQECQNATNQPLDHSISSECINEFDRPPSHSGIQSFSHSVSNECINENDRPHSYSGIQSFSHSVSNECINEFDRPPCHSGIQVFSHSSIKFSTPPDWYAWEREEVKKEIRNGTFKIDCDCRILVLRDFKAVYDIGRGHLTQDAGGITVKGENGLPDFFRPANASYSLYADYYWYELGDMICVGNKDFLYYCFPDPGAHVAVAKARLGAEEAYKACQRSDRPRQTQN